MSDSALVELLAPVSSTYDSTDSLRAVLSAERARFEAVRALPLTAFTTESAEEVRLRFSGRKSPLQELLRSLKALPAAERRSAGQEINELREYLEGALLPFLKTVESELEGRKLAAERDDLTLPLPDAGLGSRHPISFVTKELLEPLRQMGFTVVDGPELEPDFFNFEALNIPEDHPARDMQDSFFLDPKWVLRTQTSSIQVHALLKRAPELLKKGLPLRVVGPGYVYRNESDITHVPTFRQMECLVIDKGVHLGHMRHTISTFFGQVFKREVKTRLRSSYFPFTEPSAELDIQCQRCFGSGCRSCKQRGWLEMGGCGLVHRNVLEKCGIDPDVYSGFAFGFGIDRIAMGRFSIPDLRLMFEGDMDFHRNFQL